MENHPTESLSAFVDNELSVHEHQQVQAHLEKCPSCMTIVDDMLLMQRQIFSAYHAVEAPDSFERQIMMAIHKRSGAQSLIRASLIFPVTAVACLMAIWLVFGSVLAKIMSVIFKFMIAGVYLLSNLFASVPSVWASVFLVTIFIAMISTVSLSRILRSST